MLISSPEDYGLTREQTLALTVDGEAPAGFAEYWRAFGDALPIAIEGAALGAGLAVIAAAQLARRADATGAALMPSRLALAHPDLGAWRWRSGRYCNGAGRRINERLVALRDESPRLLRTLERFDAALHARAIASATICKLAGRDDVVPAPAAAAVFNGLATPARFRYVTAFGHYDGGLVDARRHACFERVIPRFLDPDEDPDVAASMLPR